MNAELFDIFEKGKAFSNPLTSSSSGATSLIGSSKSGITNLSSVSDSQIKQALTAGGLNNTKLSNASDMLTSASTGVSTLVAYGDQTVSEAYSRVSTSMAYTNGLTGIGRPPTSCDTINSAFAIIQDTGARWLGAMENALATVNEKITELAELVSQGIAAGIAKIQSLASQLSAEIDKAYAAVQKVVQDITDGIAAELAHLESLAKSCINFCMSSEIVSWMKDSCVAGAIQKMATPALKTAIS